MSTRRPRREAPPTAAAVAGGSARRKWTTPESLLEIPAPAHLCYAALLAVVGLAEYFISPAALASPRHREHFLRRTGHLAAALVAWGIWRCVATDPGVVEPCDRTEPAATSCAACGRLTVDACRVCGACRPRPGVHHCRACDVCVEDFDHHCAILGCCVGRGNVRAFRELLVSIVVGVAHLFYGLFFVLEPVRRVRRWLRGRERLTHAHVYSLVVLSASVTATAGLLCVFACHAIGRLAAPRLRRAGLLGKVS